MLQIFSKFAFANCYKIFKGVLNIADDILVFGRTESEFNTNVISFLDRCIQEDIHLHPDKVKINTDSVQFFGHVLTKDGLQPDESKVKLILDWPIPENQKELQQFMGLVNYLSKFLAFLSDLRAPLQPLLKKDTEFIWTDTHTIAFNHLKGACLKPLMLVRLCQKQNLITSNNERELLGVVFSATHFKHFTYGRPVTIISDHKPLVSLFKKSLASSSPHLSRMLLQILDYDLNIVYQEGSKMHLSDALSRLSTHQPNNGLTLPGMDIPVHEIEACTNFSAVSLGKIHETTLRDQDLQVLKTCITNGFSHQ